MIELPKLPYAENALEPFISGRTMTLHHDKHHAAYVNKTNELTKGTPLDGKTAEEIMMAVKGDAAKAGLFNNAAQAWNHNFFWKCLSPKAEDKKIPEKLEKQILADFGSWDKFFDAFKTAASGHFGSGWAWLVSDKGKLKVVTTGNAANPLTAGLGTPLFGLDVWEHAYYLDYQNVRADYIERVMKNVVNWRFVGENLK